MNSPIHDLPSAAICRQAFREPIASPTQSSVGPDPVLVEEVSIWDNRVRQMWQDYADKSTFRRAYDIGAVIADAIKFQRSIRTEPIDQWCLTAAPADLASFEAWRSEFFVRCDSIASLATEALVSTDLAMPEDGLKAMIYKNPAKLGAIITGYTSLSNTVSIYLAAFSLMFRERDFFKGFIMRQLRLAGVPFLNLSALRTIKRLNHRAGRDIITHRHTELVISTYDALHGQGINAHAADALALEALVYAEQSSGKSWKGLTRLYDLMTYSGVTPNHPRWSELFAAALANPVQYTHVPGREWLIRDYQIGKKLMQIDGKIEPGSLHATLQQGRSSLATGYLRGGQNRIEFGRRYSKPLSAFLDSMVVAEGPDHQRQRKAFLPFFSQAEVLKQAGFVEQTVTALLDQATQVAKANQGRFDLRTDFAYRFPIQIVCHLLELPAQDVPQVQHWAEASVRAMDTEAGLTFKVSIEGQQASDALRAYLSGKLDAARAGHFSGSVINTVARDPNLSEAERIANLGVIIFAGFETTTGLLSKGVESLLKNPAQWDYLKNSLVPNISISLNGQIIPDRDWRWLAWATNQPARQVDSARLQSLQASKDSSPAALARFTAIANQENILGQAIEELLRWTAPGTVVPLTASQDLSLPAPEVPVKPSGCPYAARALTIKQGETIAVAVDELNRRCPVGAGQFDPGNPQALDVSRTENTAHLSFGLRHSCIGAFLAKENTKRALEGILRRFPDLNLAGTPIPQEMELFSGLASLPVSSQLILQNPTP